MARKFWLLMLTLAAAVMVGSLVSDYCADEKEQLELRRKANGFYMPPGYDPTLPTTRPSATQPASRPAD
jgi:hypothetical protein